MTLIAADIAKIQSLYRDLERLQRQRLQIRDIVLDQISGVAHKGTSGVDAYNFGPLSPEAAKDIRDVLARDIRRRAAKIVESLHKLGCEAKLSEE